MTVALPPSDTARQTRPMAALLHQRLRGSSAPVIMTAGRTLPAASLWTAARALAADLRSCALSRGDRVLVCTSDDLLLAAIIVAGLSSDLTIALLRPPAPGPLDADELAAHAAAIGARLVLCADDELPSRPAVLSTPAPCFAAARLDGLADAAAISPRPRRHPADPDVALLLRTSGSTGTPAWVALSQVNIAAVLTSHLPALFGGGWDAGDAGSRPAGVMASVLPWTHAFGAVLDLLLGLVSAQVILRDPAAGADPSRLSLLLEQAGPGAWLNAVPVTLRRLQLTSPDARAQVMALGGGIVGGASCDAELCDLLAGSALRMGYGLTEAGPGVCLGDPGDIRVGLLGQAVGCDVDVVDGKLCLTGPGVSLGVLGPHGELLRRGTDRLATNDTVSDDQGRYVFTGRVADTVKLDNGRWLSLTDVDAEVRSATGLACAAVADSGCGLALIVDGGPAAAGAVRAWLDRSPRAWSSQVHRVLFLPSAQWPLSPKGEVLRHSLAATAQAGVNAG